MVGERKGRGYNPTGFTVNEFVDYMINRGTIVPFKVNEDRWRAMLKWFDTRYKLKDWVDNGRGEKE